MLVLSLLMGNPAPMPGSALASAGGLASGTLYPILIRLEKAQWITSQWEAAEPQSKPRRRLYSIKALGIRRAREEAGSGSWSNLHERSTHGAVHLLSR
jgi:DNA-binding PadR family transcriptional regulator